MIINNNKIILFILQINTILIKIFPPNLFKQLITLTIKNSQKNKHYSMKEKNHLII